MKKVLIIAYAFPPINSPGTFRTLGYIKYLRNFGWDPIVLTVKDSIYFPKDEHLLKDIPDGIKIERVAHTFHFPRGIRAITNKIPDEYNTWLPFAYFKAIKVIKKNDCKVIYTTDPPSMHLIGYLLKKKTKIPWCVDYRDQWTQNPFYKYNFFHNGINKWLEKNVLQSADAVVSVSEGITEGLKTLINNNENKFYTITNGYDETDFSNYKPKDTYGDKFRITYTGSFFGGYPSGLRYPYHFFKIIGKLLKENKIHKNDIEIVKLGRSMERIDPEIPKENIKYIGYIPHDDVFKHIENATILLLVVPNKKGMEVIYTGKIFEYIYSKKPILALVPEYGVAADLIRKTNTGVVVNPDDVEGIKKTILDLYNKWKNNDLKIEPNWEIIKQYDRKNLTKKLAQIFDELTK